MIQVFIEECSIFVSNQKSLTVKKKSQLYFLIWHTWASKTEKRLTGGGGRRSAAQHEKSEKGHVTGKLKIGSDGVG